MNQKLKIEFRPAVLTDFEAMKAIINDAVHYKLSKNDDAWGSEAWTDEEIAEAIGFGNTNIVLLDGNIIGCVDLIWEDSYNWGEQLGADGKAGYLHRLAVLSGLKGQGLGEQIINWVMVCARVKKRQYVRLDCHRKNKSLCSYYENQGFKEVKLKKPRNEKAMYFQKTI